MSDDPKDAAIPAQSTAPSAPAAQETPAAPETPVAHGDTLLRVEGLQKHFPIRKGLFKRQVGAVQAVDGLSFEVRAGETLGVVGESGCGKSTMGRLITRLLEPTGGSVEFEGRDITHLSTGAMRKMRRDVQMIFQDPYSSLNPRHTIGTIVGAPFRLQGVKPEGGGKAEVQALLERVGLNPEHYNRYPHEFSGGQRQRIGIARALALKPKLVVADEPVSALDVSIQAQVVNLLDDLQDELGLTYVIIAHDLSVIRHVSDRSAVMYLGKIVELADRKTLYANPGHPYTSALLSAVPVPDPRRKGHGNRRLLHGDVPSPIAPPSGCRFHTRCWKATASCATIEPPLIQLGTGQKVACHHPEHGPDQLPGDAPLVEPGGTVTLSETKAEAAPEAQTGTTTEAKPEAAPVAKAEPEAEPRTEAAAETKPEAAATAPETADTADATSAPETAARDEAARDEAGPEGK
ncbi:ABC transporter ATP-binding protein [Streptomyces sp. NEAU-H3]|uniref:ABC transporter ATP-binding protein n=1 Tax=Streptomyces sp. NEAU-H3 TaxID=2720636 RepID=UPI00143B9C76|nr:dipeptide ABC transporter ATP-binding protein [Streptomyces sp. NEAU-H3]NJA56802.1 dipeptide ABC transporter ATP-binding protein [Streptomyces sp. NEAU-H3]